MHELAVCQALVSQVAVIARERGASAVSTITLRIGPLSGVEPDLLHRAYPLAAADGVAAHAELRIEMVPLRVRCDACGAESEARINALVCSECGDWRTRVVSGDELLLASVELEMGTPMLNVEC